MTHIEEVEKDLTQLTAVIETVREWVRTREGFVASVVYFMLSNAPTSSLGRAKADAGEEGWNEALDCWKTGGVGVNPYRDEG